MRDLISIDSLLSGGEDIISEAEYNKKFSEEYGESEYYLSQLSESQLWELRQDICLCSYYIDDYRNRFGIDPKTAAMFFDGYADYISEIMQENNIDSDAFFDNLKEFDTEENLYSWHCIVYSGIGWF